MKSSAVCVSLGLTLTAGCCDVWRAPENLAHVRQDLHTLKRVTASIGSVVLADRIPKKLEFVLEYVVEPPEGNEHLGDPGWTTLYKRVFSSLTSSTLPEVVTKRNSLRDRMQEYLQVLSRTPEREERARGWEQSVRGAIAHGKITATSINEILNTPNQPWSPEFSAFFTAFMANNVGIGTLELKYFTRSDRAFIVQADGEYTDYYDENAFRHLRATRAGDPLAYATSDEDKVLWKWVIRLSRDSEPIPVLDIMDGKPLLLFCDQDFYPELEAQERIEGTPQPIYEGFRLELIPHWDDTGYLYFLGLAKSSTGDRTFARVTAYAVHRRGEVYIDSRSKPGG